MGERVNIAKIAEIVSSDLFGRIGWELHGPPNESWACVNQAHQKADHPTDATFVYEDPYTAKNVHLVTDLKSYAAGSITAGGLKESIESLALAVDCAKENPHWRELYLKAGADYEVQGLLFIYNHDATYDRSFQTQLLDALEQGPRIPRGVRVSVLGPDDVWYLNDILKDLATLAYDKVIPSDPESLSYFYPSQSRARVATRDRSRIASIDVLKGKHQIITFTRDNVRGALVYYRGPGASEREFIVLIDMLRLFGMLDTYDEIHVRLARPDRLAAGNFSKATSQYAAHTTSKMDKLRYGSVAEVTPRITQFEVAVGGPDARS